MAVTKTTIVSVLVVLAITYNQGAARPSDINNELYSSEGVETRVYKFPTAIKEGLIITINGTIDNNDSTFIVELPSSSGKDSCQITYNYLTDNMIYITPAVDGYESREHDLKITPGSNNEGPFFSLMLVARVDKQNNDMFEMTFYSRDVGPSSQLICKIDSFDDIDQIVVKQGVARVENLLFEFK